MAGERNLQVLLRGMEPFLHPVPYAVVVADPIPGAFALVAEAEGMTVVAEVAVLLAAGIVVPDHWARISLTIHSDLSAVGLTAAFAAALAAQGISANVVAGFHHDHVLVPWEQRGPALATLQRLARDA